MIKISLNKNKLGTAAKILLVAFIFLLAAWARFQHFEDEGNDIYAYEKSVEDLLSGVNPYIWTIESFSNPKDPSNHGYAYLPLLLYINVLVSIVSHLTGLTFAFLSKFPILFADIGVGLILAKIFYRKNFPALIAALLFWFWNPYFFMKGNFVYTDPLPTFLSLLALYFLEKDDVLSGTFLALAIAAKPYSIIFLPLFLLKANKPLKLFAASAMIGFALSIPFLRSWADFSTYLQGALFVHGDRYVQGRPFLFFISWYGKIELIRIIPIKYFAYASILSAWLFGILASRYYKIKDKYSVAVGCLLLFFMFTPVLNKTYLLWLMPLYLISVYGMVGRKVFIYYSSLAVYWIFYYVYLFHWKEGFHVWHP